MMPPSQMFKISYKIHILTPLTRHHFRPSLSKLQKEDEESYNFGHSHCFSCSDFPWLHCHGIFKSLSNCRNCEKEGDEKIWMPRHQLRCWSQNQVWPLIDKSISGCFPMKLKLTGLRLRALREYQAFYIQIMGETANRRIFFSCQTWSNSEIKAALKGTT